MAAEGGPDENTVVVVRLLLVVLDETVELVVVKEVVEKLDDDVDDRELEVDELETVDELLGRGAVVVDGPATLVVEVELLVVVVLR